MAHRIKRTTKFGSNEIARIHGAPDTDMAAMYADSFGGHVHSVEQIADDASFMRGESDWNDDSLRQSGMPTYREWEASK